MLYNMNILQKITIVFLIFTIFSVQILCKTTAPAKYTTQNRYTRKFCITLETMVKAKSKSCFLRADTGPCRAGIVQWYYDAKKRKCYRFFWGGCQGNGNRFETKESCLRYCHLNSSDTSQKPKPFFCDIAFDYGTCFGHYNRWSYDKTTKSCRRRLYSGCGGNQNNFESRESCLLTCVLPPNNSLPIYNQHVTCIPVHLPAIL